LAGALHDNNAATLVGEKSYGKGVVQEVIPGLPGGAELKITAAHWFRPNGENIDGKGIQPDKPATLTAADVAAQRDPQKDAALSFLQGRQ
jgi:carboxyl-terminal processing protease